MTVGVAIDCIAFIPWFAIRSRPSATAKEMLFSAAHAQCKIESCITSNVHVQTHQTVGKKEPYNLKLQLQITISRAVTLRNSNKYWGWGNGPEQSYRVQTASAKFSLRKHIFPMNHPHLLLAILHTHTYWMTECPLWIVLINFKSNNHNKHTVCLCVVVMVMGLWG